MNIHQSCHQRDPAVRIDQVNLLSRENAGEQARVIPEALQLLGDDIAVFHAKDFVLENGTLKTVPAGRGQLDYVPVLQFIRSRKPGLAILLEEAGPEVAGLSAQFLLSQM